MPHAPQIQLLDEYRLNRPLAFRRIVRVNPLTFDEIVKLIEDHPIFHNNSSYLQLSPASQLAIFLNRAGHYGNRAGPEEMAEWAGCSVGTVENCSHRVMVSLLSLHDDAFGPPSENDSQCSGNYGAERTCPEWKHGRLTVDGTKFPLFQRPGLHGDAWFDKDKHYSVNGQVCNNIFYFWMYSDKHTDCFSVT